MAEVVAKKYNRPSALLLCQKLEEKEEEKDLVVATTSPVHRPVTEANLLLNLAASSGTCGRGARLVAPELLPRAPIQPLNLRPSLVIPSTVWKFHLSLENVPLLTTTVKYPSEFRRITGFHWLWPFRGYTCIVNFHSLSHLRHGF